MSIGHLYILGMVHEYKEIAEVLVNKFHLNISFPVKLFCYSLFSRFIPSMIGCHPYTSETMMLSI